MVVIITIIPVMLCQRFGVCPCVLFHNTSLARCGCVNVGICELRFCCTSPSLLRGAKVGSDVGSPPAWSPTAPRAALCLPWAVWAVPGSCNSAGSAGAARMRGRVWIPCCLPRGWERGSISHPGGCWRGICPCCVPVPCLSAAIRLSLMVRTAEKSRGSLAAGRGWRQLHHSGSLQPPCGCSLSAQAQTSLKLIPLQNLGLLGLLSSGHKSSSDVQVVFFPRAVAFCEVLPCGSARLPLAGSTAALG